MTEFASAASLSSALDAAVVSPAAAPVLAAKGFTARCGFVITPESKAEHAKCPTCAQARKAKPKGPPKPPPSAPGPTASSSSSPGQVKVPVVAAAATVLENPLPSSQLAALTPAHLAIVAKLRATLLQHCKSIVEEVVLGGSMGKETAVATVPENDLDFVAVLKKGSADSYGHDGAARLQQYKAHLLAIIQQQIDPAGTGKSVRAIAFKLDGVEIDLHLAFGIRPYELGFLADEDRFLLEAAQTTHQMTFVRRQPPLCKQLIRLLKAWRNTWSEAAGLPDRAAPISFLLELLAIFAFRRRAPGLSTAAVLTALPLQSLLLDCFVLMEQVCRCEVQVTFLDPADPCSAYMVLHELHVRAGKQLIVNPVDPSSTFTLSETCQRQATEARLQLQQLLASSGSPPVAPLSISSVGSAAGLILAQQPRSYTHKSRQGRARARMNEMDNLAIAIHKPDATAEILQQTGSALDLLEKEKPKATADHEAAEPAEFVSQLRARELQRQLKRKLPPQEASGSSPSSATPAATPLGYPYVHTAAAVCSGESERQIGLEEVRRLVDLAEVSSSASFQGFVSKHLRARIEFLIGMKLFYYELPREAFERCGRALVTKLEGICPDDVPEFYLRIDPWIDYYATQPALLTASERAHHRIVRIVFLRYKLQAAVDALPPPKKPDSAAARLPPEHPLFTLVWQLLKDGLLDSPTPSQRALLLNLQAQLLQEFTDITKLPDEESFLDCIRDLKQAEQTKAAVWSLAHKATLFNAVTPATAKELKEYLRQHVKLAREMTRLLSELPPVTSIYRQLLVQRVNTYRRIFNTIKARQSQVQNSAAEAGQRAALAASIQELMPEIVWSVHANLEFTAHPLLALFSGTKERRWKDESSFLQFQSDMMTIAVEQKITMQEQEEAWRTLIRIKS